MNWPNDADGDVLRRLQESGFDLSKATLIDFNVDFQIWPPPTEAVALLSREYPSLKLYPPDDNGDGYLQFQVYALASYELVMNVQSHVTELMAPFKGECDSWGILQEPAG